jgi:antitoxin PrlF
MPIIGRRGLLLALRAPALDDPQASGAVADVSETFYFLLCKVKNWNDPMRVSTKGQVTIPKQVRERAGIRPGSEVEFDVDGEVITMKRVPPRKRPGKSRGEKIVEALAGSRTANRDLSTDELMRLLRGDD